MNIELSDVFITVFVLLSLCFFIFLFRRFRVFSRNENWREMGIFGRIRMFFRVVIDFLSGF